MINWNFLIDDYEHPLFFTSKKRRYARKEIVTKVPVVDLPPRRRFTQYELDVIAYYEKWGYVETKDRSIISDYIMTNNQTGDPILNRVQDIDQMNQDDNYIDPYHWDFSGGYNDETLPQYIDYI